MPGAIFCYAAAGESVLIPKLTEGGNFCLPSSGISSQNAKQQGDFPRKSVVKGFEALIIVNQSLTFRAAMFA